MLLNQALVRFVSACYICLFLRKLHTSTGMPLLLRDERITSDCLETNPLVG
jgi:hypothetical protein